MSVWLSQHVGCNDELGFPLRIRMDSLRNRGVPRQDLAFAAEMQACIARRVRTANDIEATAAAAANDGGGKASEASLASKYHCRFVGVRISPGGTQTTDPAVQEAALNDDVVAWAAMAAANEIRVSHLHLCFEWSCLSAD